MYHTLEVKKMRREMDANDARLMQVPTAVCDMYIRALFHLYAWSWCSYMQLYGSYLSHIVFFIVIDKVESLACR